jgi:VanZ family protein
MKPQETKTSDSEIIRDWNRKAWLWVLLCSFAIFFTIPVARSIQKFISHTIGREFFTYFAVFIVICGLAVLFYLFIFKFKVREISQYVWLVLCAGIYIFFTIKLNTYPEEAIHLIEYGLLSYFVFKALSHRVHDWTIYITTILIVLFIGTTDEFIQWMIPKRYWDFRDVGTNVVGGLIFQLAIWKGIRPGFIDQPIAKISVKMLMVVLTVDLIFLGLCLSNTPRTVKSYTAVFQSLSWLRAEEPMSKFAFLKTAWSLILISLISIWMLGMRWLKRLK